MPLSDKDYQLFEQLVRLKQSQLHIVLQQLLKKKYKKVITTPDYIVAFGDIPIALVAHLDTVFKEPVSQLYYDKKKNVVFSPDGLGADDRAGVFAILQILKTDLRPSVIFTTDEEMGGLGAAALALAYTKCPISGLKYLIELDRQGSMDAVFYDCETADFKEYVESFGFLEAKGSFSDISFLMSEWKICGVNLSVGYKDEHTRAETLNFNFLFNTVEKVKKMLQAIDIPDFVFEEKLYIPTKMYNFDFGATCAKCKAHFSEYETIPVKTPEGITKFYCPDCVYDNVDWCKICGEAYQITNPQHLGVCEECYQEAANG